MNLCGPEGRGGVHAASVVRLVLVGVAEQHVVLEHHGGTHLHAAERKAREEPQQQHRHGMQGGVEQQAAQPEGIAPDHRRHEYRGQSETDQRMQAQEAHMRRHPGDQAAQAISAAGGHNMEL